MELPIRVRPDVEAAKKALLDVRKGVLDLKSAQTERGKLAQHIADKERKDILDTGDAYKILKLRVHDLTKEIEDQAKAEEKASQAREKAAAKRKESIRQTFDTLRLGAGALSGRLGSVVAMAGTFATGGMAGGLAALGIKGLELGASTAKDLYSEGRTDVLLKRKLQRQYGGARADAYLERAGDVGQNAGVEQSAATAAMIKMVEGMPTIAKGTIVTAELAKQLGMKGTTIRDEATADRLRTQMEERRFKRYQTLQTLNPEMQPEALGNIVANLFSGGLGARQFAGAFGLPKIAQKIIQANEAGKLAKEGGLSSSDLGDFKGKIKGGKLAEGDLIELLSRKFGLDDKAADERRGSLEFQAGAIRAKLGDVFSDIGSDVYEGLNKELSKSGSLAKDFSNYIKSPEGAKMVHDISADLTSAAKSIGEMIAGIPKFTAGLRETWTELKPIRDALGWLGKGAGYVEKAQTLGGNIPSVSSLFTGGALLDAGKSLFGSRAQSAGEMAAGAGVRLPSQSSVSFTGPLMLSGGAGMTADDWAHQLTPAIERNLADKLRRDMPARR